MSARSMAEPEVLENSWWWKHNALCCLIHHSV